MHFGVGIPENVGTKNQRWRRRNGGEDQPGKPKMNGQDNKNYLELFKYYL